MVEARPARKVEIVRTLPERVRVKASHRRSAGELNESIIRNLGREYGSAAEILAESQSAFHFRNPESLTNAEPYELLEGGYIDTALENLGEHRWVIGRPKDLG